MQLIVTGLNGAKPRFKHLWGRYVLGFRPWKHCIGCFESKVAPPITPTMMDGAYDLDDRYDLFYLCGVGQPDSKRAEQHLLRRATNVHLAVRPLKGSVAAAGSVYGVTFTLKDAAAIPIQPLPEGFRGLPKAHYRCKNFQFGYQMFDAPEVGEKASRDVIRKRRGGVLPSVDVTDQGLSKL
jgi:hypothetical protein